MFGAPAKRFIDILGALLGLVVLSPVMLLTAVGVGLFIGRPVLFVQPRPGKDARPFPIRKFRSMRDAVGDDGTPLPDKDRLNAFGSFLRSSSLDELPELWNVLVGEMSLVGPRPLLMEYLPLYNAEQARRHEMRPGLTGWAQVKGRNSLNWDEKFRLDVWYIENQSFWLDLKIIWLTVLTVFRRQGIAHAGDSTMPRFKGNST